MTITTLLRFLIGEREAILTLAASRWTLVVGACFVLSAAFAREYDGEDLLAEPAHLLIPFAPTLARRTGADQGLRSRNRPSKCKA